MSTPQPTRIRSEVTVQRPEQEEREERYYLAGQTQLIWMKFRRHKLAIVAMVVLGLLYLVVLTAEFVAPYDPGTRFPALLNTPPQKIHFIASDGRLHRPFIYAEAQTLDQDTFQYVFTEDKTTLSPVRFFVHAEKYRLLGIFRTDVHLFGTGNENVPIFLFGSDTLGRDLFSRIIHGTRISLTIGLVGVFIGFILGLLIGGISGYFGGAVDNFIQRAIDFLISMPQLPLWMALSAALPRNWPVVKTYFAITIVLSIIGWCGLARVVRGKLLALREEDFALAARASGAGEWRIITRHLLPSFFSYLIVSITLSVPNMIIGETTLSFLGLGMRPPAVSWGVLLQDAQQLVTVAQQPWLLIPCVFVIVTVLMFNFLGDGLRDAADPYTR